MFGAVFISGTKHSHVPVLFLFSGPKIHVAPINVKFGTGERIKGPLPHAKFHVYRGRNVGMQPPKLKILNFGNKFVPQGRLVCTIFTKLSAFVRVYR